MAQLTTDRPATASAGSALPWIVLVAALAQVVAPAVTINGPGASPGSGAGADLLITPVGWAFSIWGVIYTLAIAQAVAGVLPAAREAGAALPVRFRWDQVALYAAAVLWIVMAALDSSTLTFLALALMFVAAVDGVLTLARADLPRGWFATLTRIAWGLFAGWVSAAFFLNASTAMVGWDWFGARELGWQLALLVVAAVTVTTLVVVGRLAAFAVAGAWAFIGITVTGLDDGTTEVTVLAAAAVVVVAVAGVLAARPPAGSRPGSRRA
ncbi:hypothetical protein [Nocardioides litoris]|uniref:hypothetical protein n=1 Tax=Nocardioides litoris TaxID=1926648 RepID=UPI00111EE16C|nr:hypothetical protein [Nocardioides litoris]